MAVLIFDIDGTLFDTKEGILRTFKGILDSRGIAHDEDSLNGVIGPPVFDSFVNKFGMTDAHAKEATIKYRKLYVEEYIGLSRPYDDAFATLERLRSDGHYLAIATMKTRPQMDALNGIYHIYEMVDTIETASGNGDKGKADMIKEIMNITGKCGEEVFMVGDTNGDFEAAGSNGVCFIGAVYGYGFSKEKKYPFQTIDKMEQIVDIVHTK